MGRIGLVLLCNYLTDAIVVGPLQALLAQELADIKPLIQDMALDPPGVGEGGVTGEANFAKLRTSWLQGERTGKLFIY